HLDVELLGRLDGAGVDALPELVGGPLGDDGDLERRHGFCRLPARLAAGEHGRREEQGEQGGAARDHRVLKRAEEGGGVKVRGALRSARPPGYARGRWLRGSTWGSTWAPGAPAPGCSTQAGGWWGWAPTPSPSTGPRRTSSSSPPTTS